MLQDSLWDLATRLIYSTPNPHCASLKISIYNLKIIFTFLQIICKQNSKIGLLRIANCLDIFLLRFAMRWTPCLLATLREFFITNTQSSPIKISYCHIFKHIQKGKTPAVSLIFFKVSASRSWAWIWARNSTIRFQLSVYCRLIFNRKFSLKDFYPNLRKNKSFNYTNRFQLFVFLTPSLKIPMAQSDVLNFHNPAIWR